MLPRKGQVAPPPPPGDIWGASEYGNRMTGANMYDIAFRRNYRSLLLSFRDITTWQTTDGQTDDGNQRVRWARSKYNASFYLPPTTRFLRYMCRLFCLSVCLCLSAGVLNKLWMHFHEIFRRDTLWDKKITIDKISEVFRSEFGSRSFALFVYISLLQM